MLRTTKQMNEMWLRDIETRGKKKIGKKRVKNGRVKWNEIKERQMRRQMRREMRRQMRRQMSDSDLKWRKKINEGHDEAVGAEAGAGVGHGYSN